MKNRNDVYRAILLIMMCAMPLQAEVGTASAGQTPSELLETPKASPVLEKTPPTNTPVGSSKEPLKETLETPPAPSLKAQESEPEKPATGKSLPDKPKATQLMRAQKTELARDPAAIVLSPQIRVEPILSTDQELSIASIRKYTRQLILTTPAAFESAPKILTSQNREDTIGEAKVYVGGLETGISGAPFQVANKMTILRHPKSQEILEFIAWVDGDAELLQAGEPAQVQITKAYTALDRGARFFPLTVEMDPEELILKDAKLRKKAYIIAGGHGFDLGVSDTVIISQGTRDSIEAGQRMAIHQSIGIMNESEVSQLLESDTVPPTKVGELIISKTYEKISLGLITKATHPIRLLASVHSP